MPKGKGADGESLRISRRVMHVLGFGYQPYDEDWLMEALEVTKGEHGRGGER